MSEEIEIAILVIVSFILFLMLFAGFVFHRERKKLNHHIKSFMKLIPI